MKNYFFKWLLIPLLSLFFSCKKSVNEKQESSSAIPLEFATKVASKIPKDILTKIGKGPQKISTESENLEVNREITNVLELKEENGKTDLYILNYSEGGYLIMSADKNYEPICGYVEKGNFSLEKEIPGGLGMWFNKTINNIQIARNKIFDNEDHALTAWWDLINTINSSALRQIAISVLKDDDGTTIGGSTGNDKPNTGGGGGCIPYSFYNRIDPLLSTQWGQGETYNETCPQMSCTMTGNDRAWTGCVATAMSQIVRYHRPNNQYSYNYNNMSLNIGNNEVPRLMKDAGNNVSMKYGCGSSGAQIQNLITMPIFNPNGGFGKFGLKASLDNNYYGITSMITNDIESNKPLILSGCNDKTLIFGLFPKYSNCHAWICDGRIKYINNCFHYYMLHMNWGWNETWNSNNNFNGWFNFNNWNVPQNPNSNYQYAKELVYNIHI